MKRSIFWLAGVLLTLSTSGASGEEARPGRTLVLHHGWEPGIASAMAGTEHRDGRLAFAFPSAAPTARVLAVLVGTRPRGPVIDQSGRIFVGTTSGLAIVSADGTSVREVSLGALDCSPVLVPGGDVVGLSRDGMLARVTPDGYVRWRVGTSLPIRFSPLVLADGSFAVVAASRTLAHVGSDLEVRAQIELPDGLALSPTRTARDHWVIAAGTELVWVDPSTLEIELAIALPGRAATPAAVAPDGTLWVATVEGELVRVIDALRIDRVMALGARLPEATTSDRAMLAVAPDGDVLVSVPTRGLVRFAPDGTERWTWASETPLVSSVSVDANGRAAAIDRVGHLSVVDVDGTVLWTLALETLPLGPAIVTGQGRIVVATERGVVVLGP